MNTMVKVAHWFTIDKGTIIGVFGTHEARHALPKFIIDRKLICKVCFQMTQGFLKVLNKGKKKPWPPFHLTIGVYIVENFKQIEAKAAELYESHFLALNY